MNEANQHKLIQAFPRLFRAADKTPYTEFGIQCGDGWYDLIYKLCSDIESVLTADGTTDDDWPHVLQIKEKFGGLRFYISRSGKSEVSMSAPGFVEVRPVSDVDAIGDLIEAAEDKALEVCEDCSAPGTMYRDGWWHVKCDACEKIYRKKREEFLKI